MLENYRILKQFQDLNGKKGVYVQSRIGKRDLLHYSAHNSTQEKEEAIVGKKNILSLFESLDDLKQINKMDSIECKSDKDLQRELEISKEEYFKFEKKEYLGDINEKFTAHSIVENLKKV